MQDIISDTEQVAIKQAMQALKVSNPFASNAEKTYVSALACVGLLVCKFQDLDNGNLACAFAVNRVVQFALGQPIDDALDTRSIYSDLLHGRGIQTVPVPGAVVVSPTTYREGATVHGHTGIVGKDGLIYSNSSALASIGQWCQNYTLDEWHADLVVNRGLQTYFFLVQ